MSDSTSLPLRYVGNCGVKVSNICLGAMTFGERPKAVGSESYVDAHMNFCFSLLQGVALPGQCDEELAHSLLDKFVALGGNFVDTADVYSGGVSEKIVGSWLKKQEREKIVLATKVRFPTGTGPNDVGLSRKHIMFAVEESLKRLDTPYIDLYQAKMKKYPIYLPRSFFSIDPLLG